MSALLLIWCLLSVSGPWKPVEGSEWTYSENMEQEEGWSGICATGQRQSPINIVASKALTYNVEPLVFIHYDTEVQTTLTDNGHTVVLHVEQPCLVSVAAGGLRGLYHLDELHFHWGSEHKISNERFALELHLVHYSSKYKTKKEALGHHQGLAVIGVLFHVATEDNPNLETVINAIEEGADFVGDSAKLSSLFSPDKLLPKNRHSFFRYEGSLTTPPCLEIVTWTVFENTIPISHNQLEKFKTVNSTSGPLKHNFRETKPLKQRTLYLLSDEKSNMNAAINIRNGILLITCNFLFLQLVTY